MLTAVFGNCRCCCCVEMEEHDDDVGGTKASVVRDVTNAARNKEIKPIVRILSVYYISLHFFV